VGEQSILQYLLVTTSVENLGIRNRYPRGVLQETEGDGKRRKETEGDRRRGKEKSGSELVGKGENRGRGVVMHRV
jgi:hypothetical protein